MNSGRYRNSRYFKRQRPETSQPSDDQVIPASRTPNMASESSATLLRRMTSHFAARFPDRSQQAMNRPVVISEKEVESGMLKPVRTARMRVARSSGVPFVSHAAGLSGIDEVVAKRDPSCKVGSVIRQATCRVNPN